MLHNKIPKISAACIISLCILSASASAAENSLRGSDSAYSKTQQLENLFTTADLEKADISDLLYAMENGHLTSEKLVQMYIDRINAYDKKLNLNSVISINENALEQARAIDNARKNNQNVGLLGGIPIIVKDNIDVDGMATSGGTIALAKSIAPNDSYAVSKLTKQGAIIIGKANLSEFMFSGSSSRSILGGVCHNAYDSNRTPAGSSGGTAVAVASSFAAAGLGTDTFSSVRRPCSYANLYGLRPSFGLVSCDGVLPLNRDNDTVGPMCKSADDLALMLDIIAGTDKKDPITEEADSIIPADGYTLYTDDRNNLDGIVIGYLENSFGYNTDNPGEIELDPKISDMTEQALSALEECGATLVDISDILPNSLIFSMENVDNVYVFEYDVNTYLSSLGENAPCASLYEILETGHNRGYSAEIYTATKISSISEMSNPRATSEWRRKYYSQIRYRSTVDTILKSHGIDAVVYISQTDVCGTEETSDNSDNPSGYINSFGPIAGLPDIMIPMGFSDTDSTDGVTTPLPLGMSLFTSYGNDEMLIKIACAYDQATNLEKPPSITPALPDEALNSFTKDLINEAKQITAKDYTSESYRELSTALSISNNINYNDVYSVQKNAYRLAAAYDGLVPVNNGNNPQGQTTSSTSETTPRDETENIYSKTDKTSADSESSNSSVGDSLIVQTGSVLRNDNKLLPIAALSAAAAALLLAVITALLIIRSKR